MNCCILGAGSWGITLAILLNENGHHVTLWESFPEACARLAKLREEPEKLPGIKLPETVLVTNDLGTAFKDAGLVVLAVPSQFIRATLRASTGFVRPELPIVNVAKGIEVNTLKRVSEMVADEWPVSEPGRYAILSGPSHAEEVSRKIPTTVVAASSDIRNGRLVQTVFHRPYFRIYTNPDVVGVELAGALKNVIAIAAGVLDGLGFGDNTKGALMTRGMSEITRLGKALGAREETFSGLAGFGDLITTCISRHSRNRHVGEQLGRGVSLAQILKEMKMVAEGVETTRSAMALAIKHGVEMPITEKMHAILFEGQKPDLAVRELMERELKAEVL